MSWDPAQARQPRGTTRQCLWEHDVHKAFHTLFQDVGEALPDADKNFFLELHERCTFDVRNGNDEENGSRCNFVPFVQPTRNKLCPSVSVPRGASLSPLQPNWATEVSLPLSDVAIRMYYASREEGTTSIVWRL